MADVGQSKVDTGIARRLTTGFLLARYRGRSNYPGLPGSLVADVGPTRGSEKLITISIRTTCCRSSAPLKHDGRSAVPTSED